MHQQRRMGANRQDELFQGHSIRLEDSVLKETVTEQSNKRCQFHRDPRPLDLFAFVCMTYILFTCPGFRPL